MLDLVQIGSVLTAAGLGSSNRHWGAHYYLQETVCIVVVPNPYQSRPKPFCDAWLKLNMTTFSY